jgi:hypothetical protein
LAAGQVAQAVAEHPGRDDEQRQDHHADQRQPPFQGQHDGQQRQRLDDVGDDGGDGAADGGLRADHVVVQAAHQLADFGVGEKAQAHALQFAEERHAQVVDDPFADFHVEPALDDAACPAQDGREQQRDGK